MNSILNTLGYESINEYDSKITATLSIYINKTVNKDGSMDYNKLKTTYFLENDKWHIDFFQGIPQFKEQIGSFKILNKEFFFPFNNYNVNKEIKLIVYSKLFSDEWALKHLLSRMLHIKRLAEFINKKYPNLTSILDLDLDRAYF